MSVLNTRMKYLLSCLCCSIFDKMKVFPIPVFAAVRTSRIFTNSSYFRPYEVPYLLKSDKCRKYAKLGGSEVSGRGCLLHILSPCIQSRPEKSYQKHFLSKSRMVGI